MASPPLDLKVLSELFGDDVDTQHLILNEYSRSLGQYQDEYAVAYRAESCSGVQAVAHKMKSSSRTVGALALGDLCHAVEQAAKDGSWPEVRALSTDFETAMALVRRYIETEMSGA